MTAYDWLLARRTAALGFALSVFVFAVMACTDEGWSSLAGRLGRLSALLAAAGGGAAFIAVEQAQSRGELRALLASGVTPVVASLGAVVGGAMTGAVGALLATFRSVDLAPLFPRVVTVGGSWVPQGENWFETTRGILVRANGDLTWVGANLAGAGPAVAAPPRLATVVALLVAALGFPLWAVARGAPLRRAVALVTLSAGSIAAFHLVGAGRVSGAILVVPPLLLLVEAMTLFRRSARWS
ncbi:MAG TPA: hypothetical protein VJT73_05150 [Polyangiaceae bacterium]|nr:hypothetical protein [Polyangiaceae bacterium]